MLLDIHIHTAAYSPCSDINLFDAVLCAQQIGLGGICVTDHDTDAARQEAAHISRETGFPIFVGMEVLTYEGDLLVFGLPEPPAKMMHAGELLEKLQRCGGMAIAAHPFRGNGRGLGKRIARLPALSGVEVYNGRTAEAENYRARTLAADQGLPCLAGSDAHRLDEIGRCATYFPGRPADVGQLIEVIHTKAVFPVLNRQHFFLYK